MKFARTRKVKEFPEFEGIKVSEEFLSSRIVASIPFKRDQVKILIHGVIDMPDTMACIFGAIKEAQMDVDMMVMGVFKPGRMDFAFTTGKKEFKIGSSIFKNITKSLDVDYIIYSDNVAKLSLAGKGLRSHPNIAALMFEVLSTEEINIRLISVSELEISIVIDQKDLERGLGALRKAYKLGK